MDPSADSFVELVKDALEHLYDPARLRDHPLIPLLVPPRLPLGIGPAQALRQTLLDGIERLNFSAALPPTARQNRAHQILVLRYVEALPFRDVMVELSLSQPQFHREQRHALDALAALLRESANRTEPSLARATSETDSAAGYAELDAAVQRTEGPTDLNEVVAGVSPMLADLAAQAGVAFRAEPAPTATFTLASRTVLRQLVIGIVGYVLCGASGGELRLRLVEEVDGMILDVRYEGVVDRDALERIEARDRLGVVSHLAAALDGTITIERSYGCLALVTRLPTERRTLLVIDDNPDAIQLVSRLLADQHCTVIGATSVADGLGLARRAHPDLILLDLMLPEQDGWDALQTLKHDPATQDVPVVVCTVLAEERLALAIGAVEFIRKPLTRPRLLEALARWAATPRAPGATHRGWPREGRSDGSPEAADR